MMEFISLLDSFVLLIAGFDSRVHAEQLSTGNTYSFGSIL